MIELLGNDLLNTIIAISDFNGRVSFALGANANDVKDVPVPACFLKWTTDQVYEEYSTSGPLAHEPAVVPGVQVQNATFAALVIVPYGDDNSILNTQFPLLGTVMASVHGKEGPSGHRWRYISSANQFLLPDRIGYVQRFTINWTL